MRARFITRVPSVGPMLGAAVPNAQMEPSSRCGRNSEPITSAVQKVETAAHRGHSHADHHPAVMDRPGQGAPIPSGNPAEHRIFPLAESPCGTGSSSGPARPGWKTSVRRGARTPPSRPSAGRSGPPLSAA